MDGHLQSKPLLGCQQISQQKLCKPRKENNILRTLIEEKYQARILYPGKLPCRHEGEVKAVSERQKLREFIIIRLALLEKLEGALLLEKKKSQKYFGGTSLAGQWLRLHLLMQGLWFDP